MHTGQTSEYLLTQIPDLRLIGIDPYSGFYHGQCSHSIKDGMGSAHFYDMVLENFKHYNGRAELRRMTSSAAATNWSAGRIVDLVFIDGNHDTQSCAEDIALWTAFVRPGGIVSGDDYIANAGVPAAVHSAIPQGRRLHVAPGAVWWWVQP